MIDSPIHELINDIRTKYTGKRVSMVDIRNIEEKYHLCSILNIRNDTCAFLRITCFGCDEVVFEDVVLNTAIIKNQSDPTEFMFSLSKLLYENTYGVVLVNSSESVIDAPIVEPSYDFHTLKEENERLLKRCNELEMKLENANNHGSQISLFDVDD